ncbi:hypothetical protein [Streptomyces sp. NPDC048282]|uniref:phthiocerol/phthiodiolone dimycocerosyl transferase family protein n=1 Tax=Streptomyces sp. NPDC048282 TaxID=3365528 RepID=UPI003723B59B
MTYGGVNSGAIRPLAPSELVWSACGLYAGYAVTVRGPLECELLATAFEELCTRRPALGARLLTGPGTAVLYEPAEHPGRVKISSVGPGPTGRGPGQRSDPGLDPARALAELHIELRPEDAEVTVFFHHCVCDGRFGLMVLGELWSAYTELVTSGRRRRAIRGSFPDPIEVLSGGPAPPPRAAGSSHPGPSGAGIAPAGPHGTALRRERLTAAATAALVESAHRDRLPLNALISAALIRTEAELKEISPTEVRLFYPVDLRDRLTPPLPWHAGTNIFGWADFTPDPVRTQGVELARDISDRLRADLADGTVLRSAHRAPQIMAAVGRLPNRVLATNIKALPPLPGPAQLDFTDFRLRLWQCPSEPGAATPAEFSAGATYFVNSFAGRLSVELCVPAGQAPATAARRLGLATALLGAAAEGANR